MKQGLLANGAVIISQHHFTTSPPCSHMCSQQFLQLTLRNSIRAVDFLREEVRRVIRLQHGGGVLDARVCQRRVRDVWAVLLEGG